MVVGIDDNSTRKKLLQSSKLTLDQFIDIFRSTETSARQLKVMTQDDVFEKFPTFLPLFNISIEGISLCTSVYSKPTDSHSYLLYSQTLIFPTNQKQCGSL